MWDLEKRQVVQNLHPNFPITELAFAPTGDAMIGFNTNRVPVRWPIRSKEPPCLLPEVAGSVHGRFSPKGDVIAVATQSGTVQLVDSRTAGSMPGSPRDVFTPKPVAFAADGRRLLTEGFQSWTDYSTTGDHSSHGFSPGMGPHETMLMPAGERASVSPDQSLIARYTAGREKKEHGIDLLDGRTGEAGRTNRAESAGSQADVLARRSIHLCVIAGSAYSRMGHDVRPRGDEDSGTRSGICGSQLVVSSTGAYIATASVTFKDAKETIRVFDSSSGAQVFTATAAKGQPRIAFSPDSRWFAAVVASDDPDADRELRIWDVDTGKVRLGLPKLGGQPAFSPDGRTLAVTHEDGIVLLEVATGQARHEFHHHGSVEAAWPGEPTVVSSRRRVPKRPFTCGTFPAIARARL